MAVELKELIESVTQLAEDADLGVGPEAWQVWEIVKKLEALEKQQKESITENGDDQTIY